MQRGIGMVVVVLMIAVFGLTAAVAYLLGQKSVKSTQQVAVLPSPTFKTTTTIQNSPLPIASVAPQDELKSYSFEGFQFKYPENWIVNAKIDDYIKGPYISIEDPSKKVMIEISSPDGYPFGFGGSDDKVVLNDLMLSINNSEYKAQEVIANNKSVFVNLKIEQPKPVKILFGVDYPTHSRGGTVEDYQKNKETIIKILESLRF